jgi:hypothetical protein
MIEEFITKKRADQLIADGQQTVPDPLRAASAAFVLAGPGLALAEIAYTDSLPSEALSNLNDGSLWTLAILRIEPDGAKS